MTRRRGGDAAATPRRRRGDSAASKGRRRFFRLRWTPRAAAHDAETRRGRVAATPRRRRGSSASAPRNRERAAELRRERADARVTRSCPNDARDAQVHSEANVDAAALDREPSCLLFESSGRSPRSPTPSKTTAATRPPSTRLATDRRSSAGRSSCSRPKRSGPTRPRATCRRSTRPKSTPRRRRSTPRAPAAISKRCDCSSRAHGRQRAAVAGRRRALVCQAAHPAEARPAGGAPRGMEAGASGTAVQDRRLLCAQRYYARLVG